MRRGRTACRGDRGREAGPTDIHWVALELLGDGLERGSRHAVLGSEARGVEEHQREAVGVPGDDLDLVGHAAEGGHRGGVLIEDRIHSGRLAHARLAQQEHAQLLDATRLQALQQLAQLRHGHLVEVPQPRPCLRGRRDVLREPRQGPRGTRTRRAGSQKYPNLCAARVGPRRRPRGRPRQAHAHELRQPRAPAACQQLLKSLDVRHSTIKARSTAPPRETSPPTTQCLLADAAAHTPRFRRDACVPGAETSRLGSKHDRVGFRDRIAPNEAGKRRKGAGGPSP